MILFLILLISILIPIPLQPLVPLVKTSPPPSETVQGLQSDLAKYKSELFKVHMRRVEKESGKVVVTCNYCNKDFKWNKFGGYGMYWKHINTKHLVEAQHERSRGQYQISRKLGSSVLSKKSRAHGSSSSSSTYVSEVDLYVNTFFEFLDSEDFNILHWWREHETNFPILALIAKQIFGTPVSTVVVEQKFSAGGNVLDERRALLSPDSIQIQVCIDDWTKTSYRQ
ncbi:hypothetical protein ACOSQ4_003698 [Xanthoceras sorbifolium]